MRRVALVVGVVALVASGFVVVAVSGPSGAIATMYGLMADDLSGAQEVGTGDPDGSGSAYVRVSVSGDVCFDLTTTGLGTITLAHIHDGDAGENGPVVVDFDFPTNGLDGCVSTTPTTAQDILADPDGFYVNVHTSQFAGGAIRGQLGLTVTTLDDTIDDGDDALSLREAIDTANNDGAASTIELGIDRVYQLDRCGIEDDTNNQMDLDHNAGDALEILGNGSTIEQTCDDARVLESSNVAADVLVFGLSVTGGDAVPADPSGNGGGLSLTGDATIDESAFFGNESAASGGGLYVAGTTTISRSFVGDNQASEGGGIRAGDLTLVASTVYRNTGTTTAGGISTGNVELVLSTLAGNSSPGTSQVLTGNLLSTGSIYTDGQGGGSACTAGLTSGSNGYNFVDDAIPSSCGAFFSNTGDVVGTTSPNLRPLFPAFRQPTSALIPYAASGATDAIPAAHPDCTGALDQRGLDRPQAGTCDRGAIELEVCSGFFSDVPGTHPFCFEIGWMAATEVSTGFSDGTYRPNPAVTRAAMSAFMYRLAGEPAFTPPGAPTFSDVPLSHPFFTEIEWMADEGITTGFPGGTYKPADPVKRQSMSAFMYRLAGEPAFTPPGAPTFSDVPLDHPFFTEIEWMAEEEVTTGFPDGTYKPGQDVSRQAMSAFMYRLADGLLPGQI